MDLFLPSRNTHLLISNANPAAVTPLHLRLLHAVSYQDSGPGHRRDALPLVALSCGHDGHVAHVMVAVVVTGAVVAVESEVLFTKPGYIHLAAL